MYYLPSPPQKNKLSSVELALTSTADYSKACVYESIFSTPTLPLERRRRRRRQFLRNGRWDGTTAFTRASKLKPRRAALLDAAAPSALELKLWPSDRRRRPFSYSAQRRVRNVRPRHAAAHGGGASCGARARLR